MNHGTSSQVEREAIDADQIGVPLPGDAAFDGSFPNPHFGQYAVRSDFTTRITSAYGLARLSLADRLKVMIGGNVTHARRRGSSYDIPYVFDATKLLPFAGATLDLSGHLTAYASFATIFSPQFQKTTDGSILPPAEGETYEGGV